MSYLLQVGLSRTLLSRSPGYVPALWYPLADGTTASSNAVSALDTLYLTSFTLAHPVTVEALGIRIITGAASSTVKLAVWRNARGRPGGLAVVGQNTAISCASSNSSPATTGDLNTRLGPGEYWAGAVFAAALPTAQHLAANLTQNGRIGGAAVINATQSPHVSVSTPFVASGDIMALDLTGATFTGLTLTAGTPVLSMLVKA